MKYKVVLDDGSAVEVEAEFLQPEPTGDWVFATAKAVQPAGLKPGEYATERILVTRAFKYIQLLDTPHLSLVSN